jgi:hypothetical protein
MIPNLLGEGKMIKQNMPRPGSSRMGFQKILCLELAS